MVALIQVSHCLSTFIIVVVTPWKQSSFSLHFLKTMPRKNKRQNGRRRGGRSGSLLQNDTTAITLRVPVRPTRVRALERIIAITTDGISADEPFTGGVTFQFSMTQLASTTVVNKLATVFRYYKLHSIRYFYVPIAGTTANGVRGFFSLNRDPVANLLADGDPTSSNILAEGDTSLAVCLFNYHAFPVFRSGNGWKFTDVQTETTAVAQRSAIDHEMFGWLTAAAISTAYGNLWAEMDISFKGRTINRTVGNADDVKSRRVIDPFKPAVDDYTLVEGKFNQVDSNRLTVSRSNSISRRVGSTSVK